MLTKNLLIVMPIYIANEDHLYFSKQTYDSVMQSRFYAIVPTFISVVNKYESGSLYKKMLADLGDTIRYNTQNSVSSAWNVGLRYQEQVKRFDYILFINNDILVHPDAIHNLVKFAEKHTEYILWSGAQHENQKTLRIADTTESHDDHPHFSFFMVKNDFVRKLSEKENAEFEPYPGMFDENIKPAYLEDNDMHQRILRAGYKAGITSSSKFFHFGSRTINVDDNLKTENNITHAKNREYFVRKWGFNPETHNEGGGVPNDDPIRGLYKNPFNK